MSRSHLIRYLAGFWTLLIAGGFSLFADIEDEVEPEKTSISFYDQRLLKAIEDKIELETFADSVAQENYPDVQRRFRQVTSEFQALIADNPERIEARLIYGKFLDRFGDREGAYAQWVEVLRLDRTVAVAHQQMGTFYAEEGDYGRALAYYLTATEMAPKEPAYHFAVGELLFAFGGRFVEDGAYDIATASSMMMTAFRKAAELDPANPVYQFRYGEAFYDLPAPDWEAAIVHWRGVLGRSDLSELQKQSVWLHLARCLGESGSYDESLEWAGRVTEEGLMPTRDAVVDAVKAAMLEKKDDQGME